MSHNGSTYATRLTSYGPSIIDARSTTQLWSFCNKQVIKMYPQSSTNLATIGFLATIVNSMDKHHQGKPLVTNAGEMGNFGGIVFGMLGRGFKGPRAASSQYIQGTIDLMYRSLETQTNHSHDQPSMVHQGSKQFTNVSLLRYFE